MSLKGWAVTTGIGVAAGAVGILMLSKTNPARRLAARAADRVENAAWKFSDKLTDTFEL